MFPSTSSWNVFFVSCQGISSQGGRVSSMQNCEAILQSQEKYTEKFFLGRHGLGMLRYVEQHGLKNPVLFKCIKKIQMSLQLFVNTQKEKLWRWNVAVFTIFSYANKPEIRFGRSGRQSRLKTRIGAERAKRV